MDDDNEIKSYTELPEGEACFVSLPIIIGLITGVACIKQFRDGTVHVLDSNMSEYNLGILEIDLPKEIQGGHEHSLCATLAPLCTSSKLINLEV